MKSIRGVTLIELMVTLSLVAILAVLAAPSFREAITSSRLRTSADSMSAALAHARGEAVRRGVRVTVCRSSTYDQAVPVCDTGGGAWSDGWISFVDADGDVPPEFDAGEEILRRGEPMDLASVLVQTTPDVADAITYRPDGSARLNSGAQANGIIRICAPGGQRENARDLRLRPGGRLVVLRVIAAGCVGGPNV